MVSPYFSFPLAQLKFFLLYFHSPYRRIRKAIMKFGQELYIVYSDMKGMTVNIIYDNSGWTNSNPNWEAGY